MTIVFKTRTKPQELKQLKFSSYNRLRHIVLQPTFFFFSVASAFLSPLIYSKSSCHKHPIAFAASHISLNHTFVVFPKWEVKERVGEKHQKKGCQVVENGAFRNSS